MKKLFIATSLIITAIILLTTQFTRAAFNANKIIDDFVFSNSGTMSATQIDAFLNNFPNSCISSNSGFQAKVPTGYSPSGGFTYGGFTSAGWVIYTASQVYGINPQVLLVTLQKEQSLVAGGINFCSNGDENKYSAAAGYGCPDSGTVYNWSGVSLYRRNGVEHTSTGSTCVNSSAKAGFSQQVIRAAWLLKFGQQRSLGNVGWSVIGGNWNNSDDPQSCYGGPVTQGYRQVCPSGATSYYDGYKTIDGTAVHMDSGATAALYWYTPHFHGNQNFSNLFAGWFGSLYAGPYTASYYSQSVYPTLDPGQQTTSYISYQNVGSQPWYDDTTIGSAPAGSYPVHLATSHDLNRSSTFSTGWPTPSRPVLTFSSVYESDGTTLAGNQHVAQPGQIVKFNFTLTATNNQLAGNYQEFFQPVAEGASSGGFNDPWTFMGLTVGAKPSVAYYDQSLYPSIYPSQTKTSSLRLRNNGNSTLYDDTSLSSAPTGTLPVHLSTYAPLNRSSTFSAGWPSSSRSNLTFSAVYEADGVTPTTDQHIAKPGQIIRFSFPITVPEGYSAGVYRENFQPILEGSSDGFFQNLGAFYDVTVLTGAVVSYSTSPSQVPINANQKTTTSISIKNSGNAPLDSTTRLYTSNGAPFSDSGWLNSSVIINSLGSSLAPAQTKTLTIPLLAPDTAAQLNSTINLEFQQSNGTPIQSKLPLSLPILVTASSYGASYFKQSGYPSFTYGQSKIVSFVYKNTGNQSWYDDTSLASADTRNPYAVHLATAQSLNRFSGFNSNWPSTNRPAVNFSAVYESDGTTLATNQHVAQPGQIVKFEFQMSPGTYMSPGSYREYFQPIVEGSYDGKFGFLWTFMDVTVIAPTFSAQYRSESPYPHLSPGQQSQIYITYLNTGTAPWYDDSSISSAPSNVFPVHLATSHNLNRASIFSQTWPSTNRPAVNFSAVYESDGTTLATNQHVAQPGQIVKFSFPVTAPNSLAAGNYREFFQPIVESTYNGAFNDTWTFIDITSP